MGDKISELVQETNNVNKDTPFFIAHGDADQVVRYEWGVETAKIVKEKLGRQAEFKTYKNLPHSAALEEIDDLEAWINKCLAAKGEEPVTESAASTKTAVGIMEEGKSSI